MTEMTLDVSYTGHQKFINHFKNDIERLLKL